MVCKHANDFVSHIRVKYSLEKCMQDSTRARKMKNVRLADDNDSKIVGNFSRYIIFGLNHFQYVHKFILRLTCL